MIEDIEFRSRSLASIKRAREKELRETKNINNDENSKNVKREVSIPELITIRDLANRMAEQSSSIIKHAKIIANQLFFNEFPKEAYDFECFSQGSL